MQRTSKPACKTSVGLWAGAEVQEASKGGDAIDPATSSAGAFVNALTTIATGALVFSIGLVPSASDYTWLSRAFILATWALLALSILCGLAAQATIPMHTVHKVSVFNSPIFEIPVRAQQITFFLSVACLGTVLVNQLVTQPVASDAKVSSASEALLQVRKCFGPRSFKEVLAVEAVRGIDAAKLRDVSWHMRFLSRAKPVAKVDVFIMATDGSVRALPNTFRISKDCLAAS